MFDAFKLTAVLISGALWSAWLVLVLRKKNVHPLRDALEGFGRLGWMKKVGVLFIVTQLTMFGGAKHGGTNDVIDVSSTNEVEIVDGGDTNGVGGIVLNAPQPMFNGATFLGGCGPLGTTAPTVVDPDVVRGYRLSSVSTNDDISYAMPSEGVVRGTWHLTGAYEDVQKIGLGGLEGTSFRFPIGNQLCTSLWAYTWGKIRPQLKNASNEIVAVGAPMSAIPGVSRFWTMATSNDSYLLTWENFAAGRINGEAVSPPLQNGIVHPLTSGEDTASPFVSAQIEFFRNGDFIARSNNVECVYRRVIEPNPIGPGNPEDPDNPGMPVCPYGPVQDLSVIQETNAYCWVDIVVNNADSWVRFEGDGASNLADPSFAAKAGETNHVVILLGKTYKVTCDMPFAVVGKSDPSIDEWWEDGNTLWLNWPVNVWSVGDDEEPPLLLMSFGNGSPRRKGFTMFVSPAGLGGGFTWTNCCCSVSGSGYYFSYNCNGDCSCGGCAATGYFSYEGYRLSASGGSCGCGSPEEPHDPHGDPDDPPVPVGVSASFSKRVIFLENEYANTTNEVVPWYSDTSSLCCSAWGGENGGHVSINIVGGSNLIQFGGQPFPIERDLEPYEVFAFTNTYKAVSESSGYEAIVVTATFDENDTDWSETSIAKATAVRVEVEPATAKPGCDNRHVLGVGEVLRLFVFPSSVSVDITAESGWTQNARGGDLRFICPLSNSSNGLTVNVGGDSYVPSLQVFKPQSIVCRVGRVVDFGFPVGTASGIGMQIEPIIEPESVAFTGIRMMERPTLVGATPPSGYFAVERYSDFWAHTTERGAGVWRDPNAENLFFLDTASFGEPCPSPWSEGSIDWDIEIGWGDKDAVSLVDVIEDIPTRYHQITSISSDGGVKVEKFGQWVRRMPSGSITHSSGIGD